MTFDVTSVESMQWNRVAQAKVISQDEWEESSEPAPQISPEVLAQVQDAISAEVNRMNESFAAST